MEIISMDKAQMHTKPDKSRRSFLKILPLGVLAGVIASLGGAAFRFLRPRLFAATDAWLDSFRAHWPAATHAQDRRRTYCGLGRHDRGAQRFRPAGEEPSGVVDDLPSRGL
jgi:hypothetical protein